MSRKSREDIVSSRIIVAFVYAMIGVMALIVLNRLYTNIGTALMARDVMFVLSYIVSAAALAAFVVAFIFIKQKKSFNSNTFTPLGLAFFLLVNAAFMFIAAQWYLPGIRTLYFLLPIACVLYLIYNIYQFDFFICSVVSTASMYLSWSLSKLETRSLSALIISIATTVILLALILVIALIRKNGGKIGKLTVFSDAPVYPLLFVSCIAGIIPSIFAILIGSFVAYYMLIALIVYYIVIAIYYTIKLM